MLTDLTDTGLKATIATADPRKTGLIANAKILLTVPVADRERVLKTARARWNCAGGLMSDVLAHYAKGVRPVG